MLATPAAIPVTTPVPEPTAAIPAFELTHEPPPVVFDSVVVRLTQANCVPVLVAGRGLIVTTFVVMHSIRVYEMVTTPGETALTAPEERLIEATAGLLLVQEPPEDGPGTVIEPVLPSQIADGPEITALLFCTYSGVVFVHPVPKLYVIVVMPTARAVATPVPETTVATDGVLLLQVPPGTESTSVLVPPIHILNVVAEANTVFTVTTLVAAQLPTM
jgi:hypothetical protein